MIVLTAHAIYEVLKDYHLGYTISENTIPNQIDPIRVTINSYTDITDLIEILTRLKKLNGIIIELDCKVML